MSKNKSQLDLSSGDIDGLPLFLSSPKAGNHHDLHEIKIALDELFEPLTRANIALDGLFY